MCAPQNYVFLDLELNILQSRNSYFSIIIRPGKICIFFFQLESHCDMDCQKAPIACPFSKFGCRERVSYKCSFSFYTHFKSFQVKVIFSCHGPPSKYHFHFSNTWPMSHLFSLTLLKVKVVKVQPWSPPSCPTTFWDAYIPDAAARPGSAHAGVHTDAHALHGRVPQRPQHQRNQATAVRGRFAWHPWRGQGSRT